MPEEQAKLRVRWYRSPVSREDLARLNRRSDFKGFLQAGGYLATITATAAASLYSFHQWPWYATVMLVFLHGMCCAFLINAVHELVHDSVFKSHALNVIFVHIFSFLGWHNHHGFWASHTEHHKYTLHPPDDLEVVLPTKMTLGGFLRWGFVNFDWLRWAIPGYVRKARGQVRGRWESSLFPESDVAGRRRLRNWARISLAGHALILVVSIVMHWWLVPVLVSLNQMYGGWLFWLCNNTQHSGLKDKTSDYRLCCRTITLSPMLRFLYWHMNFHTEHHMYAAVPCYNLGKLHRLIRDDLPPCPSGLVQTWKQIIEIQKKQAVDPSYQYEPELPTRSDPTLAAATA